VQSSNPAASAGIGRPTYFASSQWMCAPPADRPEINRWR